MKSISRLKEGLQLRTGAGRTSVNAVPQLGVKDAT
jgi:hypothetical protein